MAPCCPCLRYNTHIRWSQRPLDAWCRSVFRAFLTTARSRTSPRSSFVSAQTVPEGPPTVHFGVSKTPPLDACRTNGITKTARLVDELYFWRREATLVATGATCACATCVACATCTTCTTCTPMYDLYETDIHVHSRFDRQKTPPNPPLNLPHRQSYHPNKVAESVLGCRPETENVDTCVSVVRVSPKGSYNIAIMTSYKEE